MKNSYSELGGPVLTPKFGNVIANERLQKKADNLTSIEFKKADSRIRAS